MQQIAAVESEEESLPSSELISLIARASDEELRDKDAKLPIVEYMPADLQPGMILQTMFSRPGGAKYVTDKKAARTGRKKRKKRVVTDAQILEKMSNQVVNTAHAKLSQHFAHTPFGFFCPTAEDYVKASKLLQKCRQGANLTNYIAYLRGSERRVKIEIFPYWWDHTMPLYRNCMSEMIVTKLINLRKVYTSDRMWEFRVRMDAVRHMEKLVGPEQGAAIVEAVQASEAQRKIMVAIYGDKIPREFMDPVTGDLQPHVRLDYTPIDKAIRVFYPEWTPPTDPHQQHDDDEDEDDA
jgi:hypothetical protein